MRGRRLAQMAAALKTCIVLHEAGELDDRLQPVGKELIKYDDEDCEWEEHELHGQARPGTTKRKQYYNKQVVCLFASANSIIVNRLFVYLQVLQLYRCVACVDDADSVVHSIVVGCAFLTEVTASSWHTFVYPFSMILESFLRVIQHT